MKYDLTTVLSSIINAKGEDIIDRPDEFMRVLTASAPDTKNYAPTIYAALVNGAVMMIAQAKNDDTIGQTNAVKIAIEILINEANADKNMAIEVSVAFAAAFGFVFGEEKSEAQLIEDAKAHISKKEYNEAIKLLNTLDSKGNRDAAYLLANIYYNGIGVPVAYKKAIGYLEKSGTSDALNMLGRMYIDGNGCTKDNKKAISLWQKSAEMGSATAEYQLAMVYLNGILGEKVDVARAAAYLKSASAKGFAPAVKAFAALPKEHKATDANEIEELISLANDGDVKAIYKLANCYFKGDGVSQSKSKAIELYTKAANNGHYPSMLVLITRYTMDSEIIPAWTIAKLWYDKAKAIDASKISVLHPSLVKGEELFLSISKNSKNKREKFEEAAKMGYIGAFTAIAKMYRSNDTALPYLRLAADAGDAEAIELLLPKLTSEEEISLYTHKLNYINNIKETVS